MATLRGNGNSEIAILEGIHSEVERITTSVTEVTEMQAKTHDFLKHIVELLEDMSKVIRPKRSSRRRR
jgi:hypothetical protein